jgi:hypothetical protein
LKAALEAKFPGIVGEIANEFDATLDTLRYDTFILSLSEHAGVGNTREDKYGRLSMWRAYGQGTGVALVVRQEPFWNSSTVLGTFMSPVAYLDDAQFSDELEIVATALEANGAFLDQIGRDATKRAVLNAFQFSAICTKHPGFEEEREWRVVASKAFPIQATLPRTIETIRGVPQTILTLELKDHPPSGLVGFTPPDFLDRVIIGPTEYPIPVFDAFLNVMEQAHIPDFAKKLFVSHIPLRPSSP